MTQYALMPWHPTPADVILRLDDLAVIPRNNYNRDWQAYQAWRDEGNLPTEAAPDVLMTTDKVHPAQAHLARRIDEDDPNIGARGPHG